MEVTCIIVKLLVCISAMLCTTQRLAVFGISIFCILLGHMYEASCAIFYPEKCAPCVQDPQYEFSYISPPATSVLGRIVSAVVSMFLPPGVRLQFGEIDFLAARRLELTLERVPFGPSFVCE
jgi:hypothetical protein